MSGLQCHVPITNQGSFYNEENSFFIDAFFSILNSYELSGYALGVANEFQQWLFSIINEGNQIPSVNSLE